MNKVNVDKMRLLTQILTNSGVVDIQTLINGYFMNNSKEVLKELFMKTSNIEDVNNLLDKMNYSVNVEGLKPDVFLLQRDLLTTFGNKDNFSLMKDYMISTPEAFGYSNECPGVNELKEALVSRQVLYTDSINDQFTKAA